MLNFFRKIRQDLLFETRFSRYFIYALGEIILVVVGILIALQINTWNEQRKEFDKSKNYLSEIIKDLAADTSGFNRSMGFATQFVEYEKWTLEKTEYEENNIDTLWLALGGFYSGTPLNRRTYEKIQNAGESKLQGFDTLFNKITTYYTNVHDRYHGFYEWDKNSILNGQYYLHELDKKLEPGNTRMSFLASETSLDSFPVNQNSSEQIKNLIDYALSPGGRSHFKHNYIRHMRTITAYEEAKAKAIILISEIKEALNQL